MAFRRVVRRASPDGNPALPHRSPAYWRRHTLREHVRSTRRALGLDAAVSKRTDGDSRWRAELRRPTASSRPQRRVSFRGASRRAHASGYRPQSFVRQPNVYDSTGTTRATRKRRRPEDAVPAHRERRIPVPLQVGSKFVGVLGQPLHTASCAVGLLSAAPLWLPRNDRRRQTFRLKFQARSAIRRSTAKLISAKPDKVVEPRCHPRRSVRTAMLAGIGIAESFARELFEDSIAVLRVFKQGRKANPNRGQCRRPFGR